MNMFKLNFAGFFFLTLLSGLQSCKVGKQLPYFKDLSDSTAITVITSKVYLPLKLQTDDELQITISNSSPEASQYFNMTSPTPLTTVPGTTLPGNTGNAVGGSNSVSATSQSALNIYRVSYSGYITLPILKEIKAAGLTTDELKTVILDLLQPYLKDPVVIIKLTNFKVTVIGEVGRPVVVPVNGQTIKNKSIASSQTAIWISIISSIASITAIILTRN